MSNRSKILPPCNVCGTLVQASIENTNIDFWCPKCQIGQSDINKSNFDNSRWQQNIDYSNPQQNQFNDIQKPW